MRGWAITERSGRDWGEGSRMGAGDAQTELSAGTEELKHGATY